MGEPGDLLLIFADALVRSWKQITKFKPAGRPAPSALRPRPAPVYTGDGAGRRRGCHARRGGARRLQPRGTDSGRARRAHGAGERRLNAAIALPFEDSRRLTGANLFFAGTGAVLEPVGVGRR